ncbi:MAG TPA: helix-hairpin-helix domain-containing protein [Stackebrandtia sp.]|jgi:hypothetical protein|uniref:ComEA family DNA-binding protein n=1 Tax=Stackebrandtia sp. TaxID=2023065 RepID=UPI002D4D8CE8|nr:helix-hairpin-helix domain-containing protein [Stackebrandtia sp.]HZE38572.1 helix-hairpin-helix domain-containing protein [Stackebrandtia sp.]
MNPQSFEGVRVLLLGTGPRIHRARQMLSLGGAVIAHRFTPSLTYVVVDRTVPQHAPQVIAARRSAIPVITTLELQEWPGMESLADAIPAAPGGAYLSPQRAPVPAYYPPPPAVIPFRPTPVKMDPLIVALGWGALPLITGGFATPFIVGHVAHRMRSRSLALMAGGYSLGLITAFACWVTMSTVGAADVLLPVWLILWFVCWLGGGVHAFLLAEKVRRHEDARDSPLPLKRLSSDPVNAQALAAVNHRRTLRNEARDLAVNDPVAARELGIGRPDKLRDFDDGGLVDVNHADADALRTLPGVTPEIAEEIIRLRETNGPFLSTSELIVHTDLDPRMVDRLDELALYMS